MRALLIISVFFLAAPGFGQHIKKKCFGEYEGLIPGYSLDIGTDVIPVSPASIRVSLRDNSITQEIGNVSKTGTWTIIAEEKTCYVLNVQLEGQLATERITVYKKGKKLRREGVFPQPAADLRKK